MSRRKEQYTPQPRIWTATQVGAYLGHTASWFYQERPRLEQLGFPRHDKALGGWDSTAIKAWVDQRSGNGALMGLEAEMMAAARGDGQSHAAIY